MEIFTMELACGSEEEGKKYIHNSWEELFVKLSFRPPRGEVRLKWVSRKEMKVARTSSRSFQCRTIFLIPFYLQAARVHLANDVTLKKAWRGVLSSTPPYPTGSRPSVSVGNKAYKLHLKN
jgi:hypothetical protein